MIHPARKAGETYENYCPKGKLDVEISSSDDSKTSFICFPDPEDCQSTACVGDFSSVITGETNEIELNLCVDQSEEYTAAVWEINVSKVNFKNL